MPPSSARRVRQRRHYPKFQAGGSCSCSGAVDSETFFRVSAEGIRAAGRSGALIHAGRAGPDHPMHLALPETSYLKVNFHHLTS